VPTYTRRALRWPPTPQRRRRRSTLGTIVRGAALGSLAAAALLPLVRKRLRVPPAVTTAAVAAAPFALAVLRPRTRARDVGIFALQMWAFTVIHELPYDDRERLRSRLNIRYPIRVDRALGFGDLPTHRLQRAFSRPGPVGARDVFLTIVHWAWFLEPHAALLWVLLSDEDHFPRSARQMAAAFDLGCLIYVLVPTAPPWWAGENGHTREPVRRIMVEVGEPMWGRAWPKMYESLGGNPWAAMPSLHFATSLLAAILLAETGRDAGAAGWGYAGTLGFALVYLGEHYVVDLLVAAGLVALIRRGEPLVAPVARRISGAIQRLERVAAG
jgi:membrane-associated phospholipid phosphatase